MRGKSRIRRAISILAASVLIMNLAVINLPIAVRAKSADEQIAVVHPEEYTEAMKNPLMGLAEKDFFVNTADEEYCLYDQTLDYIPWSTMVMSYIPWDDLENDESDTIDDIADYCDKRWRGKDADGNWHSYEEYNIKVIPRVYLRFPTDFGTFYGLGGDHWPADMKAGDMTSSQFDARLKRLIERLGKLWDNDSRVAYVQMGIFGTWGEQHGTGVPSQIGKYFTENFKNKQVQVRYYDDSMWSDYSFGQYNDSIGDMKTDPDKWPTCAIGGEPAYDYGSGVANIHGDCPHVTSTDREYTYNTANMIRKTHAVYLTWCGDNAYGTRWSENGDPHGEGLDYYYQNKAVLDEGAQIIQKELGYRYVISEFSYTKKVLPGENLDVAFKVQNQGSAPMYYNWPVQVSLKDPDSGEIVWNDTFKSVDIREWQPGNEYTSFDKKSGKWSQSVLDYINTPETYTVEESFTLPSGLEKGKDYVIQLAVLDPEGGNVPSLRFAIKNYTAGGYHPMGYIGIGKTPEVIEIDKSQFDSPAVDTSLRYYRSGSQTGDMGTLESVSVVNSIPSVACGTEGYDLTNLSVTGTNSDGTIHNLDAAEKEWKIENGFEFAVVRDGILRPLAEGDGTISVSVNGIKSSSIPFHITEDTGAVSGTVTDKSGNPLAGVKISLLKDDQVCASSTTADDGKYQITSILSGNNYKIIAEKEKYREASASSLIIERDSVTTQDFILGLVTAGRYTDDFSEGAGNWTVNKYGVWNIEDGAYVHEAAAYSSRWRNASTLKNKMWDDAVYEADIKCMDASISDENWGAIMFRRSSVTHTSGESGYVVLLRKNGQITLNVGNLDGKGNLKELAKAETGITDLTDNYHHLKVIAQGSSIKVFVDDNTEPVLAADDTKYAYGYMGLGANDKGWAFDNVVIIPFTEPVTKEELISLIETAEMKLENGTYTDESIEGLNTAIAAAKIAAENQDVSEEEIADALNALNEAVDQLVTAYLVTIDSNDGGKVGDGEKEIKMVKREYRTISIIPDESYHIESIQVNGVETEISDKTQMSYVIKMITANVNLKVIFAPDIVDEDPGNEGKPIENQDFTDDFSQGEGNWVVNSGSWEITEEQEYMQTECPEEGSEGLYTTTVNDRIWTDAEFHIDMLCSDNSNTNNWAALMFRKQKQDEEGNVSGYFAVLRSSGKLELLKAESQVDETFRQEGTEERFEVIASSEDTLTDMDEYHHLRIESRGNQIRIFVDDESEPRIDAVDDTYVGGYAGLGTYSGTWKFKNLEVIALNDVEPEKTMYTITAVCNEGGSVTPSSIEVEEGGSALFNIVPYKGYAISDVTVDGTSVGTPAQYTIDPVLKNMEVNVTFKLAGNSDDSITDSGTSDENEPGGNTDGGKLPDNGNSEDINPDNAAPDKDRIDGGSSAELNFDRDTSHGAGTGTVPVQSVKTGDVQSFVIPTAGVVAAFILMCGSFIKIIKKRGCNKK